MESKSPEKGKRKSGTGQQHRTLNNSKSLPNSTSRKTLKGINTMIKATSSTTLTASENAALAKFSPLQRDWAIKLQTFNGLSIESIIERAALKTDFEVGFTNAYMIGELHPRDNHLGEKQSALMFENFDRCNPVNGPFTKDGYVRWNTTARGATRKAVSAHRFLMELELGVDAMFLTDHNGKIVRAEVEHICKVRNCLNRTHHARVTHAENLFMATLEFCRRGHDVRNGGRYADGSCIECKREQNLAKSLEKALILA